jgi:hypothetical protein
MTPEKFDEFLRGEMESNGKIIRALNIRLE